MYTSKNLTVMFTDICGFTQQTGTMSRGDMMQRLASYQALLTPIVHAWGGTLVKSIGDAFLVTFESPTDALHCGLCLQHGFREHNRNASQLEHIHIKISVNCGEVALTEADVFGDPVNVAAKVEKATEPDQVYFTESVFLAMNQAEVPCEFVKTFAARGDATPDIKLYGLLLDETSASHQKIVQLGLARLAALGSQTKQAPTRSTSKPTLGKNDTRRFRLAGLFSKPVLAWLLGVGGVLGLAGGVAWYHPQWYLAPWHLAQGFMSAWLGHTPSSPAQAPVVVLTPSGSSSAASTSVSSAPIAAVSAPSVPEVSKPALPAIPAVLLEAEALLNNPSQLKEQSHAVIDRLVLEFGDNPKDPRVQAAMLSALKVRLYWQARKASLEEANALLKSDRSRFLWVQNWSVLEREAYLGALHTYASNPQIRRDWRNTWSPRWENHYSTLKTAATNDADFALRFVMEFNEVNQQRHMVPALEEQVLLREALMRKPELLQSKRSAVLALVQSWLQFEQAEGSYARELARQSLYADLRPWLIKNLEAMQNGSGENKAAYPWRQNCLALLASKNDLGAIDNPWHFIKHNPDVFMQASSTTQLASGAKQTQVFLRREHMQRLLQRPMGEEDRQALTKWIDTQLQGMNAGGPWAGHEGGKTMILAMQEDLARFDPSPATNDVSQSALSNPGSP